MADEGFQQTQGERMVPESQYWQMERQRDRAEWIAEKRLAEVQRLRDALHTSTGWPCCMGMRSRLARKGRGQEGRSMADEGFQQTLDELRSASLSELLQIVAIDRDDYPDASGEIERRLGLALEIVANYAEHGSWRCQYRTRYKECVCGLDERLAALGLPPCGFDDPEAK